MPKKVKLSPGLRLDLPDFTRISSSYTDDVSAFVHDHRVSNSRPYIVKGFHLFKDFTAGLEDSLFVSNGTFIDAQGNIVTDEEDHTPREITLPSPSTTYYVEVRKVDTDGDPDDRAVWDPSYDNGTGTPGREFPATLNTRIATTWEIVQPVSTSGFAYTTNPNTDRVPVGIVSTDGSGNLNITNGALPPTTNLYSSLVTTGTIARVRDLHRLCIAVGDTVAFKSESGTTLGTRVVTALDFEANQITVGTALTGLGSAFKVSIVGDPKFILQEQGYSHVLGGSRLFEGRDIAPAYLFTDNANQTPETLSDFVDDVIGLSKYGVYKSGYQTVGSEISPKGYSVTIDPYSTANSFITGEDGNDLISVTDLDLSIASSSLITFNGAGLVGSRAGISVNLNTSSVLTFGDNCVLVKNLTFEGSNCIVTSEASDAPLIFENCTFEVRMLHTTARAINFINCRFTDANGTAASSYSVHISQSASQDLSKYPVTFSKCYMTSPAGSGRNIFGFSSYSPIHLDSCVIDGVDNDGVLVGATGSTYNERPYAVFTNCVIRNDTRTLGSAVSNNMVFTAGGASVTMHGCLLMCIGAYDKPLVRCYTGSELSFEDCNIWGKGLESLLYLGSAEEAAYIRVSGYSAYKCKFYREDSGLVGTREPSIVANQSLRSRFTACDIRLSSGTAIQGTDSPIQLDGCSIGGPVDVTAPPYLAAYEGNTKNEHQLRIEGCTIHWKIVGTTELPRLLVMTSLQDQGSFSVKDITIKLYPSSSGTPLTMGSTANTGLVKFTTSGKRSTIEGITIENAVEGTVVVVAPGATENSLIVCTNCNLTNVSFRNIQGSTGCSFIRPFTSTIDGITFTRDLSTTLISANTDYLIYSLGYTTIKNMYVISPLPVDTIDACVRLDEYDIFTGAKIDALYWPEASTGSETATMILVEGPSTTIENNHIGLNSALPFVRSAFPPVFIVDSHGIFANNTFIVQNHASQVALTAQLVVISSAGDEMVVSGNVFRTNNSGGTADEILTCTGSNCAIMGNVFTCASTGSVTVTFSTGGVGSATTNFVKV